MELGQTAVVDQDVAVNGRVVVAGTVGTVELINGQTGMVEDVMVNCSHVSKSFICTNSVIMLTVWQVVVVYTEVVLSLLWQVLDELLALQPVAVLVLVMVVVMWLGGTVVQVIGVTGTVVVTTVLLVLGVQEVLFLGQEVTDTTVVVGIVMV